jgi:hypothetical protein
MNRTLASSVLAASLMAVGCMSSSPSSPTAAAPAPAPATMPAAPAPATVPPAPPAPTVVTGQATTPPPPPAAAVALPPEKDMTHSFTKDTPYFADKPSAGATPSGTFKAGTKVIVLIPGAPYAKVQSLEGVVAYASIDNLEPLSSK